MSVDGPDGPLGTDPLDAKRVAFSAGDLGDWPPECPTCHNDRIAYAPANDTYFCLPCQRVLSANLVVEDRRRRALEELAL